MTQLGMNQIVTAPIRHGEHASTVLRDLYALAIAAELDAIASTSQRLTPELLRCRAEFLRDGVRRDAVALAKQINSTSTGAAS